MREKTKIIHHILLILVCVYTVFPVYWLINSSLKVGSEIFNYNLISSSINFSNYVEAMKSAPIVNMLLNSLIISLGTGFFQLAVSILFSYAFIRWEFKGKNLIFAMVYLSWLIPIQAILYIHILISTRYAYKGIDK